MGRRRIFFGMYLVLILVGYGGFLACYCKGMPGALEAEPTYEQVSSMEDLPDGPNVAGMQVDAVSDASKGPTSSPVHEQSDTAGFQFYLSEIIDFYEFIITLLLGIIGVVLVVGFLYFNFTSKMQAADMAVDALEAESFRHVLDKLMTKQFVEFKNSDEIMEIYSDIPDLKDRVAFVETLLNERSYTEADDRMLSEDDDGDN